MPNNTYIEEAKQVLENVKKLLAQKQQVIDELKKGGKEFFYETPTEAVVLKSSLDSKYLEKIDTINTFIQDASLVVCMQELETSIETQKEFAERNLGDSAWFDSIALKEINLDTVQTNNHGLEAKILTMKQLAQDLVAFRQQQIEQDKHQNTQAEQTHANQNRQLIAEGVKQRGQKLSTPKHELQEDNLQTQERKIQKSSEKISELQNQKRSVVAKLESSENFDANHYNVQLSQLKSQLETLQENKAYNPKKKELTKDLQQKIKTLNEQKSNCDNREGLSKQLAEIEEEIDRHTKLKALEEQKLVDMKEAQDRLQDSSNIVTKASPDKLSREKGKALLTLFANKQTQSSPSQEGKHNQDTKLLKQPEDVSTNDVAMSALGLWDWDESQKLNTQNKHLDDSNEETTSDEYINRTANRMFEKCLNPMYLGLVWRNNRTQIGDYGEFTMEEYGKVCNKYAELEEANKPKDEHNNEDKQINIVAIKMFEDQVDPMSLGILYSDDGRLHVGSYGAFTMDQYSKICDQYTELEKADKPKIQLKP